MHNSFRRKRACATHKMCSCSVIIMSLLQVGSSCHACGIIDFLPFTCPSCQQTFCTSHIHQHACASTSTSSTLNQIPRNTSTVKKTLCPVKECERPTIEAIAGIGDGGEGIAKDVRCHGCGQAFCVVYGFSQLSSSSVFADILRFSHRAQDKHSCVSPADYNSRQEAAEARKVAARAIISKNFPNMANKSIPKPPPPKDVVRVRPLSPERLPPSLRPAIGADTSNTTRGSSETPVSAKTAVKTKAEKLAEIHVRKIRSLAKPLIARTGGVSDDLERRFFEWGSDASGSGGNVQKWVQTGKWTGGVLERSWVESVSHPFPYLVKWGAAVDFVSRLHLAERCWM